VRPLTTFVDRMRKAEAHIATPLLQLHGSNDGCIVPPTDEDRRWFDERVLEIVPSLGHFLHVEAPATIAARVARWLA
jgi:pimeloyl-ACP methyl ester carboxylesterase